MADIVEDIVEATINLAESHDNVMAGSGFKAEENGDRISDIKKDENGSDGIGVSITEPVVVVESISDGYSGLIDTENGVLKNVLDNKNDDVGSGENFEKDIEVFSTDNGEKNGINCLGEKQGNVSCEKKEDLNRVFRVGDLVWGKIKSHPWWPGQIYNTKDASEFALKYSQEGRLLVAYFGDGSCSWSMPSQLLHFIENLKPMSTESSSKSFTNAIQSAVNDISRVVEYNMTCKCIPLDKRDGLARPLVSNVGIKKGVLVPDVDIRRLRVPEYGPSEVLQKLVGFSKDVDIECSLEVAVLRSWLSAFYRAKGYRLPVYCEPVCIEGLDDKTKNVNLLADDFSVPIEVPILGPWEDICLSSSAVMSSDDKICHKRKQKSVAELMGENGNIVKPKMNRKRKFEISETISDGVKKGILSGKPKISMTTRERKKSKYLSPPYTDPIWNMGKSGSKIKSKSEESESDTSAQTPKNDKKLSFSESDVDVHVNELLSEVEFAAVDPFYLSNKGSLDKVWAFVSALRSSTYSEGPDYKIYKKSKTGTKKRKSFKNQENDFSQEKAKSADVTKSPKKSKSKKSSEFSRARSSVEKLEGTGCTRLILTFAPGFRLPSKEEIVSLFSKFGIVNENETGVLTESRSVRIVYTEDSNAEAAFKSSVKESPFGFENVVNYWLQHSPARPEISLWALDKAGICQPADDFMSDVGVIRQKLEIMTAILENYHSTFSSEEKSSLKDEMKHLMENVETMSEKVRVMAEKTSD